MKKKFPFLVKLTLISVYLIFFAGSVVRMTGSGMGCPDWPKCFGYYIPPTSEKQLTWQTNHPYRKGMIIIKDKTLLVAKNTFKTENKFDQNNWKKYTKHNYAVFNKYHTWTEYFNRLASVMSGFLFLFLVFGSTKFWRENKKITLLTFIAFFLMLFEAWLGKTVVATNLKPTVITVHMVTGLVIISLLLKLLFIVSDKGNRHRYNLLFDRLLIVSVIFSLIQMGLGTQVRQFIDEQIKIFGFENKEFHLMNPNIKFYIHRSFSIVIVLINMCIFYLNQVKNLGYKLVNWIILTIFIEVITGILMYYANFPLGTQVVHLLAGAIMFGLQFYLWLQSRKVARSI